MISTKNYYQKLHISPTASPEEIKTVYKKLVFKYHPDRNGGNEKNKILIQELNEIYSILSDPDKRSRYDESLILGASDTTRPQQNTTSVNASTRKRRFPYQVLYVLFFILFKFLCNTNIPDYKQGNFSIRYDSNYMNRSPYYLDSIIKSIKPKDSLMIRTGEK